MQLHKLVWGCGVMRGRDEVNCPYCSYSAELEEWLKLPWSPLKGNGGPVPPNQRQLQPPAQASASSSSPPAESEEIGSSKFIENEDDQKLVDLLKKRNEF